MQQCIQVKRRKISDRIHTTVPSAFEFSGLTEDTSRNRIKFPRRNARNGRDGLDDGLKRDLKKILKRDDSMKPFTDCIYGRCLGKYGLVAQKRSAKPQKSRRQRELEWLKGEKKALRRRWKCAQEDEKVGSSVLWEEFKESERNLLRAENIRQKNNEKRKSHRRFFCYRHEKTLLDSPKSGELRVDTGELEERDDLHRIPLQMRRDIPMMPLLTIIFNLSSLLNNSAESRIREVKPLLRSGMKFRSQNE